VAAGREGGPILLVGPTAVPNATASELARLRPARIVVLGGTGVVSDGVLAALRGYATSGNVSRLAGADRFATAVAISQATTGTDAPRAVYLATGNGFADGLAGTPAAARAGGPLLILPSATLTQPIIDELRRINAPRVVILGGPGAVSDALAAQVAAILD
jgi:putative cell wall-binding protein